MSAAHFEEHKKPRGHIKHAILENYLMAWFPINLYTKKCAVFVDGFSGPGKHDNGDDGSPLLVLKMLKGHNMTASGTVDLIFIEKDKAKSEKLERNLREALQTTPSKNKIKINIHIKTGDFNTAMTDILIDFGMKPMFVFADPFGFNCEMSTLKSILQTHSEKANKELLINFMNGNVIRFLGDANKRTAIDKLMGSTDWQTQIFEQDSEGKLKALCRLYINNLQEGYSLSPAKLRNEIMTLSFSIKGKNNAHVYHILYATSHKKGIEKMKTVMNKSSQAYNEYFFSEWLEEKEEIRDRSVENELKMEEIITQIKNNFAGESNVTGERLNEFIESTHFNNNVKNELKKELEVFITTPRDIKMFKEMKFDFRGLRSTQENSVDGNDPSGCLNKDWKTRIIRIEKHFTGKTVTGETISVFFKANISPTLQFEKVLQKKFEPYKVAETGRKGFAKTTYAFPKLKKKIPDARKGQPKILQFFKPKKLNYVIKNLN